MARRSLWLVLVATSVIACDGSGVGPTATEILPQFGAGKNDVPDAEASWIATGKVFIDDIFRPEVPASYRFHAKLDKNGVKGDFFYETELFSGELIARGRVICMTVTGNKVRMGGIVTQSNTPEAPPGHEMVWSFTDNGQNKHDPPDTSSTLLGNPFFPTPGFAEAYCRNGLPQPEKPNIKGHIHLHRTGG